MLNTKKYSCALKTVYALIILLPMLAAGNIYGCFDNSNISFYNNTDIPLKIIIKRLPPEEIKCLMDGENSWSEEQRKICLSPRNYKESTIEVPEREKGNTGQKNGICWEEDDLYMTSYQVLFYDGTDYKKGPSGAVIDIRRGLFHYEAAINHLDDQSYMKTSGCTHFHTLCTMEIEMADKK